jgi:PAS domain S-box-containing protein
VILTDRTGVVSWVNDSFTTITGYQPADVHGQPICALGQGSDTDLQTIHLVRDRIAAMAAVRTEVLCRRKDGRPIWIEIDGTPVPDEPDEQAYYVIAATDVTERRRVEDALRASEERFRSLIENASDLVLVIDAKGKISYASPSAEPMLGYAPHDLIDRNLSRCVAEEDQAPLREVLLRRVLPTPGFLASPSLRFLHRDGSARIVEAVFRNLLEDPALRGIVLTARDVTERARQQEALRRRDAILATVGYAPRAGGTWSTAFSQALERRAR